MAAITVDLISTSSAQAVHSFLSRLEQRKSTPAIARVYRWKVCCCDAASFNLGFGGPALSSHPSKHLCRCRLADREARRPHERSEQPSGPITVLSLWPSGTRRPVPGGHYTCWNPGGRSRHKLAVARIRRPVQGRQGGHPPFCAHVPHPPHPHGLWVQAGGAELTVHLSPSSIGQSANHQHRSSRSQGHFNAHFDCPPYRHLDQEVVWS